MVNKPPFLSEASMIPGIKVGFASNFMDRHPDPRIRASRWSRPGPSQGAGASGLYREAAQPEPRTYREAAQPEHHVGALKCQGFHPLARGLIHWA